MGNYNLELRNGERRASPIDPQELTDASTIAFNRALGPNAHVTLTADGHTLGLITNASPGDDGYLTVYPDGHTMALHADYVLMRGDVSAIPSRDGAEFRYRVTDANIQKIWLDCDPVAESQFLGFNSSTGTGPTFNFGNFTAPAAGVFVVSILVTNGSARNVTGVTIGGSAAAVIATTAADHSAARARLAVAAGAINVTVTVSSALGANPGCSIAVYWRPASSSAVDSDLYDQGDGIGSRSVTLDLAAGGAAMYACTGRAAVEITFSSAVNTVDLTLNGISHEHAWVYPTSSATGNVQTITIASSERNACIGFSEG